MKIIYIGFVLLLLTPLVFADAYGNGSYGNGTYIGYTSSPDAVLTVNPAVISTVASSVIKCIADDSSGVISVNIRVDNAPFCNTTNFAGQTHMECSFSFTPSEHNDITKNYSISCRTENIGGMTTNKTGSLYALRDDGGGGSSGSGGGGGGGVTPTETFIFSQVLADEPVTKKLSNPNIAVKEIEIELGDQANNVKVTVTNFGSTPAQTPKGRVFQYVEVNSTISALKSAKFRFNVAKSWIQQTGAGAADVILQRFTGTWQKLPTRLLGESSTEAQYESDVPGFSLFAITAEKTQPLPVQQPKQESGQTPSPVIPSEGDIQPSSGGIPSTVQQYLGQGADFIASLLPAKDSQQRTIYLFIIFVAVQLVIYAAITRALNERKPKIRHDIKPIKARHNEKLHQFLIAVIVAIILAVAVFWLRV